MTSGRDGSEGPLGFDEDDEGAPGEREEPGRTAGPAARRLEADDRDATSGARRPVHPSGLPRGASRYGWFVGVVAVLLIAALALTTVGGDGISSTGLERGEEAPPFAAPLALSDLEGDVNVAREPDSGEAGAVPACEVSGPDVLNLCELVEDAPTVLAFFATRGGPCVRALDTLDRVARRHPDVDVAAIAIRGDRDELRDLVRERGWDFPVGYDRDGVLANLYGVAVCPQFALLQEGGTTFDTILGEASAEELDRRIGRLADAPDAPVRATEGAAAGTVAP